MPREKHLAEIIHFLKQNNVVITENSDESTIEIENTENDQCLIVQITSDLSTWVRLKEGHSGYLCESIEEFRNYTSQLIKGTIEVAIGYKKKEWIETEIVNKNSYSHLDSEVNYIIAAWNKDASNNKT